MRKGSFIFFAIDNSEDNAMKVLQMVSGPHMLQPLHDIHKSNHLLTHRPYGPWGCMTRKPVTALWKTWLTQISSAVMHITSRGLRYQLYWIPAWGKSGSIRTLFYTRLSLATFKGNHALHWSWARPSHGCHHTRLSAAGCSSTYPGHRYHPTRWSWALHRMPVLGRDSSLQLQKLVGSLKKHTLWQAYQQLHARNTLICHRLYGQVRRTLLDWRVWSDTP